MNRIVVFISYSWKPQDNKSKVLLLAERLQLDGVHVILDEWDLSEGQDKYTFMEQMVNDPNVKRVLLICNKEYTEKANQKKGGVGVESLIISDDIYSQADQKKFIPIVFERNMAQEAYLPTFVKSRIYIDLSDELIFETEYEKLLRNIFDKPTSKRPPLGQPPSYIIEEEQILIRTAHKVAAIKNALLNEKKIASFLISDYYETYLKALNDFRITYEELNTEQPIDEVILKRIESMRPLRNDYLNFLEVIVNFSPEIDLENLHEFWQSIAEFIVKDESYSHPDKTQYGYLIFDHFRFFIRELFLHQIAFLIEKQKFQVVHHLLHNPFIIYNNRVSQTEALNYEVIRQYVPSLDQRNKRLSLNRQSVMTDLLKERTSDSSIDFNKLVQADLILYFNSILNDHAFRKYRNWIWFPETTVYRQQSFSFFDRIISKRFFYKMKVVFDVKDEFDLQNKINQAVVTENNINKLDQYNYRVPRLVETIKMATIASLP